jgi:type I restriction enzyme S subunit
MAPDYVYGEGIPVVSQACVQWSGINFAAAKLHNPDVPVTKGRLHVGDVLMNSTGTGTLGRVGVFEAADDNFVADGHVTVIRPRQEVALTHFLAYLLGSQEFQWLVYSQLVAGSTNQIELSRDRLASSHVSLPDLDEQRAIVAYLDRETTRIDQLISKKQQQVVLLRERRRAVVVHAVTAVKANWRTTKLGYLGAISGGATPSSGEPLFWGGDIPWVTPKDMKTAEIRGSIDTITTAGVSETSLTVVEPPAVLFVVRGMILAHTFPVAVSRVPVTVNQDMKALKPVRDSPEFLAYLLEGMSRKILALLVEESAHGTKALRTERWKDLPLCVPPLNEQSEIIASLAAETAQIDSIIGTVRRHIELLQEYRSAVISKAVMGQLDLADRAA